MSSISAVAKAVAADQAERTRLRLTSGGPAFPRSNLFVPPYRAAAT